MKHVEPINEYKCSHESKVLHEDEEAKKFEVELKELFKVTLKSLLSNEECFLSPEQRYKMVSQFFGINSISLITNGIASETR